MMVSNSNPRGIHFAQLLIQELTIQKNWQYWVYKTQDEDKKKQWSTFCPTLWHQKPWVNSGAREDQAVPSSYKTPAMLHI